MDSQNKLSSANLQSGTVYPNDTHSIEPGASRNIEIGFWESVFGLAVILISLGIAYGRMHASMCGIKDSLDKKIEPDLKDVRERFVVVEDRVGSMWKDKLAPSSSPRKLNTRGNDVLINSGIKSIIDENRDKLLDLVKRNNRNNAYDAEIEILKTVRDLQKHCPEIVERLKDGAFKSGADIDAVLFVGGIYLRDIIFNDLGFSLDDLDKVKEK
ncbi:MAG: hypothetical protein HGB08_02265 [Candidatus Moranbacteria bacterium]|nr:hypothetical protein [Candidatus Moranbacteria bacterium]